MSALISIIVPAYNVEGTIKRCIDALLVQTYPSIQIVVVDDGSTDKTGALLDEMAKAHTNIKVICQENAGRLAARLAGIKAADGEYIGFNDSDDYCEPDTYEFLMSEMLEEDADISHCAYEMIRGERHTAYYGSGRREVHARAEAVCTLLEGRYIEPTLCTKLFKKSLFENIDNLENIDTYEDLLLNFIAFSRAEKIVYNDKVLYHYFKKKKPAPTWQDFKKEYAAAKKVIKQLDILSKDDLEIRKDVKARIRRQKRHEYKIAFMIKAPKLYKAIRKAQKKVDKY